MKCLTLTLLFLLLFTTVATAGGYKIPENSLNSLGMLNAYVAGADGPDAVYFNPAKLPTLDVRGGWESGVLYVRLPAIEFTGNVGAAVASANSEKESIGIPYFHYVAPAPKNRLPFGMRYGVSVVAPAGLSKRWKVQPQMSSAEEFTLEVVEINPAFGMHVANRWYMGGGLRMLKSKGFVRSTHLANAYQFELDGDSTDVGYNLAVNYSATKNMDIALTWRSRVDLKMEGTSVGYLNPPITAANYNFNNSAHVTIPTPATVNLGLNYRKGRTSYELVYERIFWSAYSTLDFEFDDAAAEAALGAARLKSWKNTTAIRLGARHKYSDRLTLMGAIVWDENPIPDNTLGFELPDSDGMAYSLGARYKISDEIDLGLAYARSDKKSRTIPAGVNLNGISGSFSGGGGHLVNMSLRYRF